MNSSNTRNMHHMLKANSVYSSFKCTNDGQGQFNNVDVINASFIFQINPRIVLADDLNKTDSWIPYLYVSFQWLRIHIVIVGEMKGEPIPIVGNTVNWITVNTDTKTIHLQYDALN